MQALYAHLLALYARSLIGDGQEFKICTEEIKILPDVVCIQETWKPNLDFRISNYTAVRCDGG